MKMYMGENKRMRKIWMPSANGTFYPIPMIPSNMRFLENFHWFDYIRPQNPLDIFVWRGKKKGTELKQSVQRKVPMQELNKKLQNNGDVQNARTAQIQTS